MKKGGWPLWYWKITGRNNLGNSRSPESVSSEVMFYVFLGRIQSHRQDIKACFLQKVQKGWLSAGGSKPFVLNCHRDVSPDWIWNVYYKLLCRMLIPQPSGAISEGRGGSRSPVVGLWRLSPTPVLVCFLLCHDVSSLFLHLRQLATLWDCQPKQIIPTWGCLDRYSGHSLVEVTNTEIKRFWKWEVMIRLLISSAALALCVVCCCELWCYSGLHFPVTWELNDEEDLFQYVNSESFSVSVRYSGHLPPIAS